MNVLGGKDASQTFKRAALHGTLRNRRVASEWPRTVAVDGRELAAIGSALYPGKDVAVGRGAAATGEAAAVDDCAGAVAASS